MKLYEVLLAGILGLAIAACSGGKEQPSSPPTKAASADAPPQVPVMGREVRIIALGDSLFAGYGLSRGQGYPEKLEAALRARGINARIANAGVSGDTSADGLQRLAFTLDNQPQPPDLVMVSLGGNDMLRGLSPEQTRANLDAILAELQKRRIRVLLMGMLAPPNMGADYRGQFDPIYPSLARKHHAALVPFFLQAVMEHPDLIQPDHHHPTATGVEEIVAATVGQVAGAMPKTPAPPPPR
jgi:acyl-CoA thioesterase-1